jgi:hypothetical protein
MKCGTDIGEARFCHKCGTAARAVDETGRAASHATPEDGDTPITSPLPTVQPAVHAPSPESATPHQQAYQAPSDVRWHEWEKVAFARVYPGLEGCVGARLSTRILRGLLQSAIICLPLTILFSIICAVVPMVPAVILMLVLCCVALVVQWRMIRRNGMNIPDYVMKTRWIDVNTFGPMSNRGLAYQFLAFDGFYLIVLIAMIPMFVQIDAMSSSTNIQDLMTLLGFLAIFSIIMTLLELALSIASIVAFVQIYQDKATHRSWVDKLGRVVVVDTKRGRDPLGYRA